MAIGLIRKPSSLPAAPYPHPWVRPCILQVNMLSKLPVFFLYGVHQWQSALAKVFAKCLSLLPPLQAVSSLLNDMLVFGGPDLAPCGHCEYLLSNRITYFLKIHI